MAATSGQQQLAIGGPAPSFTCDALVGAEFKKVSLSDYAGKYLVLFAYPLDHTFVCPTELLAFSKAAAEFEKINCSLVGWSVDSLYSHLAWTKASKSAGGLGGPLAYPIIADLDKSLSIKYNALLGDTGHTYRALFIIDGNGVLRHATLNDAPVGRSVDETLRLVQAFQFVDENGEVCPINWRPGKKTIKPDPAQSLEYFEAVNNDAVDD
jgi:alkyl hydroperoxide reductase subunit AhpC